jgi:5-formyltetrahydrofolate cyclo-ligase
MPDNSLSKAALRTMLLADRQAIPAEVRPQWDAAIGERLIAWWTANTVQSLGVYWPIRGEPDLRPAYEELVKRGVQLALPLVVARGAPLQFIAWSPGETLAKDAMGVAVPASGLIVHPDALLVPCVGFNLENVRLGYGGGFYDRTLAAPPRPLSVGIAYECTRAEFASEPHDVRLDEIITERSTDVFAPVSL